MKRIQVRPGKFVLVSDDVAARAARAMASVSFTREEVLRMAAAEPRGTTVYAGPIRPSQRSRGRASVPPPSQARARSRILGKVRKMRLESNSSDGDFDVEAWVDRWLELPLMELGDKKPSDLFETQEGLSAVEAILDSMRGGTPG